MTLILKFFLAIYICYLVTYEVLLKYITALKCACESDSCNDGQQLCLTVLLTWMSQDKLSPKDINVFSL